MTIWPQIVWSEAQQILDRAGWSGRLPSETSPEVYFAQLRGEGRLVEALFYLAFALSRRDAIGWALTCFGDFGLDLGHPVARAAAAWLDDASDAHRRAAERIGAQTLPGSAEQLLANAIFFSGGSVAEDGHDPVFPTGGTCGRFIACAIVKASTDGNIFERRISHALDRGEAIARGTGNGI